MLVFYTWSIRLLADSISLFGAAEKVSWLANHTPQEAGRLAPPSLPGSGDAGKPPKSTCGKVLPKAEVSRAQGRQGGGFAGACSRHLLSRCHQWHCPLPATPACDDVTLQGPEHEAALALAPKVPTGWPRSGAITFDRVVMKYAPHLPPALRGVSFNIKSGEKVGWQGGARVVRGMGFGAPLAGWPCMRKC